MVSTALHAGSAVKPTACKCQGGLQGGQAIADGAAHGQARVAALGQPHAVRAHRHPALIPHAANPACIVSAPSRLDTSRL